MEAGKITQQLQVLLACWCCYSERLKLLSFAQLLKSFFLYLRVVNFFHKKYIFDYLMSSFSYENSKCFSLLFPYSFKKYLLNFGKCSQKSLVETGVRTISQKRLADTTADLLLKE